MIFGISGAQGQGKSTLINAAVEQDSNHNFFNLIIQTARVILKEWDLTLDEVNQNQEMKRRFQDQLFERHRNALLSAKSVGSTKTVLVERTFADIFVYALVSLGPFNQYSSWLNEYAEKCSEAQRELFDHTVFLTGRVYVPEEDGVRSTNTHYSSMVDYLILKYMKEFDVTEEQLVFIDVAPLDTRLHALERMVEKYVFRHRD